MTGVSDSRYFNLVTLCGVCVRVLFAIRSRY